MISGNWKLRNEANRLRKQLGVADVLAPSQPVATVEKALQRALLGEKRDLREGRSRPEPPSGAAVPSKAPLPPAPPFAPEGPPSFPPMPLEEALRTPLLQPLEKPAEMCREIVTFNESFHRSLNQERNYHGKQDAPDQ